MGPVHDRKLSEPVEQGVQVLLSRHFAVDVGFSVSVVVVVLFLTFLFPGGPLGIGTLLLLPVLFILAPALYVIARSRTFRFGRIPAVLNTFEGLVDWHVKGLSLVCTVNGPDSSVPPLKMSLSGDDVSMFLEIPWDIPVDIWATDRFRYSDLPGLVDEVEAVRCGLSSTEFVRTDVVKRRLTSLVRPFRSRWRKPDDSPEVVRDRILDQWRHLESIRRRAGSERVFAPSLVRTSGVRGQSLEMFRGWCPRCWRERFLWSNDGPQCGKCHSRLWLVWCSGFSDRGTQWKMDQVRSRYSL